MEREPAAFTVRISNFVFILRVGTKALHVGAVRIRRNPFRIIYRRTLGAGNKGSCCFTASFLAIRNRIVTASAAILPGHRLGRRRIGSHYLHQIIDRNRVRQYRCQRSTPEGREYSCYDMIIFHHNVPSLSHTA